MQNISKHHILLTCPQVQQQVRLIWATDLHLDAAGRDRKRAFVAEMVEKEGDMFLIGGDICDGSKFSSYLSYLGNKLHKPVYFVLGNHDFYDGSIAATRQRAHERAKKSRFLHYLTCEEGVALTPTVALVGHDGWADGQAGDFLSSPIHLRDYELIEELSSLKGKQLQDRLRSLGQAAALALARRLEQALSRHEKVIVLTHIPPFKEVCLYEGRENSDWQPHFVCQQAGSAIKSVMARFPKKELIVLCGHVHYGSDLTVAPNIRVLTGDCELGSPRVQGILDILPSSFEAQQRDASPS